MTFAHCFDHDFCYTNKFWVWFIALEIRHPGLQFEYKFYLIWTYIKLGPFEVGPTKQSKLGFFREHVYAHSFLESQNIYF